MSPGFWWWLLGLAGGLVLVLAGGVALGLWLVNQIVKGLIGRRLW